MIYFFSDSHLGLPSFEDSLIRERKLVKWLDSVKNDATEIFLLGDIFEFWWEWKNLVPKHYVRFFGKLAELADLGVKLHYFTGNHDIWAFGYFEQEFGMKIYNEPLKINLLGKSFFLAHGDGLGPGDKAYKLMKKAFRSKFLQWIASNFLHPETIFKIVSRISKKRAELKANPQFKEHEEWLIKYATEKEKSEHFDYYIFGHRHIPFIHQINELSKVVVLGDWLVNFTYAAFNGNELVLSKYE